MPDTQLERVGVFVQAKNARVVDGLEANLFLNPGEAARVDEDEKVPVAAADAGAVDAGAAVGSGVGRGSSAGLRGGCVMRGL